MDIKNAEKYAGWYASYMDCDQGKCLIECLQEKIKQQENLISRIGGEIELGEQPEEEAAETIINSIKSMIEQKEEVKVNLGHFGWVM